MTTNTPTGSRGYRAASSQQTSNDGPLSSAFAVAESEPFLRDVELAEIDRSGDYVVSQSVPGLGGDSSRAGSLTNGDGDLGLEDDGFRSGSVGYDYFNSTSDSRGLSWKVFRFLRRVPFVDRFARRDTGNLFGRRTKIGKAVSAEKRKITFSRRILRLLVVLLMIFGALQIIGLVFGLVAAFFPDELQAVFSGWRGQGNRYDLDYSSTADIIPVRCHSHNDYWRTVPLKSAITAGCSSVEADVWLYGDELYVGHSESALKSNRTLDSLYVQPLLDLLGRQNPITDFHTSLDTPRNGIFDTDPRQTLVLLIDFKTNGDTLWPVVSSYLEPLRSKQYLTHFDGASLVQGAITVVVTGNAPFEKVVSNTTYRDMFFDAPLSKMAGLASNPPSISPSVYDSTKELAYLELVASSAGSGNPTDSDQGQGLSGIAPSSPTVYSPFNSYFASASITAAVDVSLPYITKKQRLLIEDQIAGAHNLGLKVRYWEIPAWPISWRNYLWRELVGMGIDYLNVDDLKAATKGDWRSQGGFGRLIWGRSEW